MDRRKSFSPAFDKVPSFDLWFDNVESRKLNCTGKNYVEKALNLQSKSYENNAFITSYKVLLLLTINQRGRTVLSVVLFITWYRMSRCRTVRQFILKLLIIVLQEGFNLTAFVTAFQTCEHTNKIPYILNSVNREKQVSIKRWPPCRGYDMRILCSFEVNSVLKS